MKKENVNTALRCCAGVLLLLSGVACSYLRMHEPYPAGLPAVRDLAPALQKLQAADAASAHLLLTEIDRIYYPDFEAPIWRMAYRPFQPDLKRVLILAGIHGNEAAGVGYILDHVRDLAVASGPATLYDIDIIALVNPWGYVHNLPFNRNGIDIGRDFASFDSSEARVIRRFLREKRYDLVLDLREDPQARGFYVWQYGLNDTRASRRTVSRMEAAGYPIEHDTSMMFLRPRSGIVEAPLWGLTILRLSRQLTIAGYIRRNTSSIVFTVVTPGALPLKDRIAMQRIAVDTLLDEYATPP